MKNVLKHSDLCALVLAGGHSTRMGTDKALLNYHGLPQIRHLFEMLTGLGISAYISCRAEQAPQIDFVNLPTISDRFIGFGPLGGILTAQTQFPEKAWLVIACDLPFITSKNIEHLIEERDPSQQATCYFNQERKQFEPLFTIYEKTIYSQMIHYLGLRKTCPQKVLFNVPVKKLILPQQTFLENANTPEDKINIMQRI